MSEGIGTVVFVIAAVVAFLFYKDSDDSTGDPSTPDPTPPSDPSATLEGPADVERWITEATRAANLTGVDRDLILAVIWQESGGDSDAVGSAGEQGLMQVTEIAAKDVGETLPTTGDSAQRQITVGAKYLAKCYEYVGGGPDHDALRCYNEGPPPLTVQASEAYASQVLDKRDALHG